MPKNKGFEQRTDWLFDINGSGEKPENVEGEKNDAHRTPPIEQPMEPLAHNVPDEVEEREQDKRDMLRSYLPPSPANFKARDELFRKRGQQFNKKRRIK